MLAVDKADSAKFSADEIENPQGWALLSFLMDARTGLGRFHSFRISNYQLMMDLIDCCRDLDVEEILALPILRATVGQRVSLRRLLKARSKRSIAVREAIDVSLASNPEVNLISGFRRFFGVVHTTGYAVR